MANRYWVGGNANWDTTAGTKWATTSGGAGGAAVPTAADDVFLDNGAGTGNVTISAAAVCRSINCTGYVGTLAGSSTLAIGDGTAGAGSIALKFVAGMTLTHSGVISFVSTSATVQEVDFAAKNTAGGVSFTGAGGSWQYTGAHTTTALVTLTFGTLDLNGQTCNWGGFSSNNTNTRTLILGASSLTMTTASPWNVNVTNLTVTANTSTVTCTAAGASFITWQTFNWNGMSLVFTGGTANTGVTTNLTFANFTFTGTAIKTGALTLYGNITTTGTFTVTGNSAINRVLVYSSTIGTARTITAAAVSLTNADFTDITGAGAASPFTGTSLGDGLGNSGITFTTPVTRYAVVAGNWSSTATWSTSSGGSGGASVPLCHDTVIMDGSSAAATYTVDMPRMGADITCTGFTRTLATTSTPNTIYGSLTLASGMTNTNTQIVTFAGRSTHTITSAGKTFGATINFNNAGGSYQLQDAFSSTGSISHNNGTLDFNSQTTTIASYLSGSSTTRSLIGGTATINLTGVSASNLWVQVSSGLTQSMTNTNIVIANASANQRDFVGNGSVFGTITYTVAGSTGLLYIRGTGDSIGGITFSDSTNARTLQFQSGVTWTIRDGTKFNVNGTSGKLMSIQTQSAGSAATLAVTTGTISCDYLSVKDNTVTTTTPAYAGANSYDVSGNTNWTFTAPPTTSTGNGNLMMMGVG